MTSVCASAPLGLRPAQAGDREFLFALRKAALGPYVVATYGPWDEAAQRAAFFARLERTLATHEIVERFGAPIGCLSVVRSADEIRLNRIFLLPNLQKQGLGAQLLAALLAEADAAQLPVRLRTLRVSPARRLYERLGFAVTDETDTHFLMERAPAAHEAGAR